MPNKDQQSRNLRQVLREKEKVVWKIGHAETSKRKRIRSYKSPGIK